MIVTFFYFSYFILFEAKRRHKQYISKVILSTALKHLFFAGKVENHQRNFGYVKSFRSFAP
jgi:hypothetical protein